MAGMFCGLLRRALCPALFCVLLVSGVSASAQVDVSSAVSLEWRAPTDCPTRDQVMRDIGSMIREPERLKFTHISSRGIVSEDPPGWKLELAISQEGELGERSLRGASCEELARAAAFILALLVDPSAKFVPKPEPVIEPKPTPRKREEQKTPRWILSISPGIEYGSHPNIAIGAGVAAGLRWRRWQIFVSWFGAGSRSESISGSAGAEARFWSWRLSTQAGWIFKRGKWEGGPTLGAGVYALNAKTRGLIDASKQKSHWLEIAIGGVARVRLSERLALATSAEAAFPTRRDAFVVDGTTTIHKADVLITRLLMSIELYF